MQVLPSAPVLAAVALAAAIGSPLAAQSPAPALGRVLMLPLADRTTLVAELNGPAARIQELASDGATILVEIGPVEGAVRTLDLTPASRSPFVDHVAIRGARGPDGRSYVHLRVTLGAACTHRIRNTGSRVYVDFAPLEADADLARAPIDPAAPPAAAAASKPAEPPPPVTRTAAAPSEEVADTAYRTLESSVLRRAPELAARSDVKGLLRLQDEIVKRDEQLGRRRHDLVEHLTAEVLRYTEQARALQLQKDRNELLRAR